MSEAIKRGPGRPRKQIIASEAKTMNNEQLDNRKLCSCGCGKELKNSKKFWAQGHSRNAMWLGLDQRGNPIEKKPFDREAYVASLVKEVPKVD